MTFYSKISSVSIKNVFAKRQNAQKRLYGNPTIVTVKDARVHRRVLVPYGYSTNMHADVMPGARTFTGKTDAPYGMRFFW